MSIKKIYNYFTSEHELFTVSIAGVLIRDNKVLIAEFAARPGLWDIPGGRVNKNEAGPAGFRREIQEELGIDNFEDLGLIDYDTWYPGSKAICAIFHLIKNDKDNIELSNEHIRYKWIDKNQIDSYKYLWPHAAMVLKKGFLKNDLLNK